MDGSLIISGIITLLLSSGASHVDTVFNPGLEDEFKDGIESGDPQECEAPAGNRCWYVDAAASDGGDGSFENPYNSFETVVGHYDGNNYDAGQIQGGDFLYVKGTFLGSNHNESIKNTKIDFGRAHQGGTPEKPTVIKSWRGSSRAIFDGEYLQNNLIHARSLSAFGALKIENVEVARANGRGIYISENILNVEVSNVVIRDGLGDGNVGTGGAILFTMWAGPHNYTIRNSLIYNNDHNGFSFEGNRGAISLLAEDRADSQSVLNIYDNIIHDEAYAIRHKHTGFVTTNVHHNLIHDSIGAFWLRSTKNSISHNVIYNVKDIVVPLGENLKGDLNVDFFKNTILNGERLIDSRWNNTTFLRELNFRDNIFHTPSPQISFMQIFTQSDFPQYNIDWITSANNVFYDFPDDWSQFLIYLGVSYTIGEAMPLISDSSSIFIDPALQQNYKPQQGSPVCGAASDGGDIGAIPCGL